MVAREWAKRFNERNPPKLIDFIETFVIELEDGQLYGVEKFAKGDFIKYNNNAGYVEAESRNTPQVFMDFLFFFFFFFFFFHL